MTSDAEAPDSTVAIRLRQILLDLARHEDAIALSEAAAVPYWAPHPPSAIGHRAAAVALRNQADAFLRTS
ncbi:MULTISPECIES: hypothetical protein [unclassified Nocardioides]|uniref:hypothetical protein n=1 Tax=unclassified Nocardioides TaxID=2615069 RepID=UPI0006FF4B8A|nr:MULTISPECIES: hypothetical protein [unclassified Nocardioides]KRA31028.1 hypothetical protein ASD81_16150 [Nocardioides sp. Root614]KRA87649.1 hypothetical protein ASD84_16425 [Nocardioides sp. Root682]